MTFSAIVPMKAHSQRVPGKNTRLFHGQPLYVWIMRTLQAVESVGRVILDTDSEALAAEVRSRFDVEVSLRPRHLHGDEVSMNRILGHILSRYPDQTHFLQTHATNPLLRPQTVERAIHSFQASPQADSLFSVTRHQSRFYSARLEAINHDPGNLVQTQDLEPLYQENSSLYLFTREAFARTQARIGARPILFEMDPLEAVDIDEERDFLLAELLMSQQVLGEDR